MSDSKSQIEESARYINPMTDFGFKKIFGEKDIMIAFLTDLLNPSSPITDVVFLDKEIKPITVEERSVIYDLRCKTADGKEFIVEMQNKSQGSFSNRIIYYLSKALSMQGDKGKEWDFDLHPVYGIFFLNFPLEGLQPQAIRTVQMKIEETGEVFSDLERAYILELHTYRGKSEDYPKTQIEYWMYNLANMETMTRTLPFQPQQPIFDKLGNIAELAHMSQEEFEHYVWSLELYRSNRVAWNDASKKARKKGHEEGLAEGLAKGRAEGEKKGLAKGLAEGEKKGRAEGQLAMQKQIALSMKQMGMTIEQITQATGLSENEISKL